MSIQDFRGLGAPADIGTFMMPASILVFQHRFSGVGYTVAVRNSHLGLRGWSLVCPANTDSVTVLNAAVVDLDPIQGGTIYVCRAEYRFTASLIIDKTHVALIGEGHGKWWNPGCTEFVPAANNLTLLIIGNANPATLWDTPTIRGIHFALAGYPYTGTRGINVFNSVDVEFTRCSFCDLDNGGLLVSRCYGIQVKGCMFNRCGAVATTVASITFGQVGGGATGDFTTDPRIEDCEILQSWYRDIQMTATREGTIANNYLEGVWVGTAQPSSSHIYLDGGVVAGVTDVFRMNIEGNVITGKFGGNGITLTNPCYGNVIHGNHIEGDTTKAPTYGISINYWRNTITDNIITNMSNSGIFMNYDELTVSGNNCSTCQRGIYVASSANSTIENNLCWNNTNAGINVTSWADNKRLVIVGNICYSSVWWAPTQPYGIYIDNPDGLNTITSNLCCYNTTDGIRLATATSNNLVDGNFLIGNGAYGIKITASACTGNTVKNNKFSGNASGCISDAGTGTILHTVRACFVKELGTAAWITTAASAMGIDIDAADEGALAKIKLPLDLQQVVRIKVWGTAQVAETDHMMLLVVAGAGGDNEAWNAEAIAPAAKASGTVNFANLDNVQWTFTSADDSDIGDLAAGDFLQWCCYYNIAVGADCATDLLLAGEGLEIQYV